LQSSCDDTLQLPCDDGDPCTIDDVQIVAVCDNSFVCEPCQGQLSVDCNTTIELPCDDGNPCTENDFEIVSACDNNFVCEPCQGIPVLDCSSTQAISCDDGDPCTENDVYLIDVCNNNEICVPCQGTPLTPLDCSDGNCANGIEYWDDITCTCLIEETFLGCTDPTACNYDPLANCDFGCDYLCADCNGIPFGTAEIDSCGKCLEPDDVLFNLSCAIDLYLPNSFTPDGDGINDYFALKTPLDLSLFEIQVYNRFGQMVFQSSDPNFQWFGNGYRDEYYLPSDTYVYLISFSRNGLEIEQVRGHISIIR
ncbi:MAG: gliding motility-associated C-terminal domain-containing protein, partial [Bacteroidota bacterium]